MTFKELQLEANKLGYKLVELQPYERFLPCICGCNKRTHFYHYGKDGKMIGLMCKRCGREAFGENETDAKRNWNKEIKNERRKDSGCDD